MNRLGLAALFLTLAACGRVTELEPQAGKSLPQKPALASQPLTAAQLLTLPPQADPDRVDELDKKGAPRQSDHFDLPPPDGVASPPPAGSDEPPAPSTTGPGNQDSPN